MTSPSPMPLVVDSFLLRDGKAVGLDDHVARFTAAVTALVGPDAAAGVPALVTRFCAEAPRTGRRFPRWECAADGALTWVDREAPGWASTLVALAEPVEDERTHVAVKGPDLPLLAALRDTARESGADDVLLAGPEGVRETGTCGIVLWEGDQAVSPTVAMPSTTLAWLARTTEVTREDVTRERLADAVRRGDAWALNALHGPRRLELAGEVAVPTPTALGRLVGYRSRWRAAARALP